MVKCILRLHEDLRPALPRTLLGGSWVVISRLISPLIWVISYKYRYPTYNYS